MITESVAAKHFLRLMALKFAPRDNEDIQREIVRALREYCVTPEHCARTVELWVSSNREFPTPVDIRHAADQAPTRDLGATRDKGCPGCQGTGWEVVWQLVTSEGTAQGGSYKSKELIEDEATARDLMGRVGQNQQVYECVRRCSQCSYGRGLAATEDARSAA